MSLSVNIRKIMSFNGGAGNHMHPDARGVRVTSPKRTTLYGFDGMRRTERLNGVQRVSMELHDISAETLHQLHGLLSGQRSPEI